MAKLNRQLRELLKDELVDEALQAKMVAALKAHTLAKLAWVPARGQRPHTLLTPYGALTVWPYFRGCWTVNRNSIPLVWQKDPRKEAVLNSLAAAQAAAEGGTDARRD